MGDRMDGRDPADVIEAIRFHGVVIAGTCVVCGNETLVEVPREDAEAIVAWAQGALIQNVLGHWPKERREMLVSGTHRECFDRLCGIGSA